MPKSRLFSRRLWLLLLLCLAPLAVCGCKRATETLGSALSSASASAGTPEPVSVGADERTLSGAAAWAQAELGDPLDQARVARSEGARRLLAEVRADSPRAGFALELLPLAPDAESELGTACGLLPKASAVDQSALLGAIAGVLARGPSNSERIDVAGLRTCARTLKALHAEAKGQDADYIESVLEQLRERSVNTG